MAGYAGPLIACYQSRKSNFSARSIQILYFWRKAKACNPRHQIGRSPNSYIRALKAHNVEITMGRHTLEPAKAPRYDGKGTQPSRQNQLDIWKLEEKETDVSIAISMYRLAAKQSSFPIEDRINHLVLVSADTDMSPALQAIREDFPDFHIGVILPHREGIKRTLPGSLQNQAHWMRHRITLDELRTHQFPDRIATKKKPIMKPDYW